MTYKPPQWRLFIFLSVQITFFLADYQQGTKGTIQVQKKLDL